MENQPGICKAHRSLLRIIEELHSKQAMADIARKIRPLLPESLDSISAPKYDGTSTMEGRQARIDFLNEQEITTDYITGKKESVREDCFQGNIENFIGMAQIPIGLCGPLLVNGTNANEVFYIPMATTEGALIASYNRGMKACRLSGGITVACISEGVQRSPLFKFENMFTVGVFVKWIYDHLDKFTEIVGTKSRYAKLRELKVNGEGNSVIVTFEYETGDASGQNMVTICTKAICDFIIENFPTPPKEWYIESNYSGDKKATQISFANGRGRTVTSEVVVLKEVVEKVLKTTPEKIAKYWQASTLAVTQSGAIGAQGHIANALTAIFIACGQDVACISESSVGLTRMEVNHEGDLYLSVTLPSLMIGTVGGGTSLPTQRECLEMMDCYGSGKSKKFAEICCAVALAGELSIASAMSAHHFTQAHETLGRR